MDRRLRRLEYHSKQGRARGLAKCRPRWFLSEEGMDQHNALGSGMAAHQVVADYCGAGQDRGPRINLRSSTQSHRET